jgi:beta-galactosidase/beta-glucuronidase
VARFNAGSYLEAQDMWRLSGVLRDATPLAVPPGDCL